MTGSTSRRARPLIPAGVPHGREAVAACAVLAVLAHLVLAQLTLVLAVAFALITRLSRWRLGWLAVPAAAGLVLVLAVGAGRAGAGFAAGPAHVLGYLGHARPAGILARPLEAFAGTGSRLTGQLPIALIAGAAEAAVLGWRDRMRTGAGAVAPRRRGAYAAARGALAARLIRAGGVVTRTGCALGVVTATGAVADLSWSQVAAGTLVVGASAQEATVTSLQVVHATLRRRKPLVVIDAGDGQAVARALTAACRATRTPLWQAGPDLRPVIGERAAALVAVRSPEQAIRVCDQLTALAADLRRIGVDGDGLVWVPCGERLPARSLRALIHAGGAAGLGVLITTASPAAAAELAAVAGTLLIHRITDPALAASLAAGLVAGPASPAIEARTLLTLGPGRFVLTAGVSARPAAPPGRAGPVAGRQTAVAGRMVPARLLRGRPAAEAGPPRANRRHS